jgi:EAL domain-containing protein (putative c-di-GMP-specific phosphodiesterase class I)
MSRTMRVTVDAERVSIARSIAAMARATTANVALVCVTGRAYLDMADELGCDEVAARHLARVATDVGRPLCVNIPTGAETSTTMFVAPKGWTDERLRGWAAGRHAELEAMFGAATVRDLEDL